MKQQKNLFVVVIVVSGGARLPARASQNKAVKMKKRSSGKASPPRHIHSSDHPYDVACSEERRFRHQSGDVEAENESSGSRGEAFAPSICLHVGPLSLARLFRSDGCPCPLALLLERKKWKEHPKTFSFFPFGDCISETTPRAQSSTWELQFWRERRRERRRNDGTMEGESFVFLSHHGRRCFTRSLGATLASMPRINHAFEKTPPKSLTTCTRPSLSTMGAFGSLTQPPLGGARWNAGLSGQRGGSSNCFACCAANIASMPPTATPATWRCRCARLLRCGLAACAATSSGPQPLRR